MNKRRVKKLKKQFVNEFSRYPENKLYQDEQGVIRGNEFRKYKKDYINIK